MDNSSRNINKETILNISINFDNNIYYIIFNISEGFIDEQGFHISNNIEDVVLKELSGKLLFSKDEKSFKLAISI